MKHKRDDENDKRQQSRAVQLQLFPYSKKAIKSKMI